ncbi:MAG: L,D-transpeptidase [Aphanothece saxicola GSE-SYN-MK-01-06B]|nr:L,D-transpeptidase [Aphanothece saxicola GSE-SYN-MK-01-06B]
MYRRAVLPLAVAMIGCISGALVPAPSLAASPPSETATASPAARQLVLNRRQRLLTVMDGEREVRRFRVGVGMPGWETPVGSFSVIEKTADPIWEHPAKGVRIPPGPTNPLGSRWIGFHRDCKGRRGFNGQEHLEVKGCVTSGFHGTPNRNSVGGAVSHGCVRLFDEDVKELFELVQVGTPVTVLP